MIHVVYSVPLWYMLSEQPLPSLFCCSAMVSMFISKVPCWTNSIYHLCSAVLQWLECSSRMFHIERTAFTTSVLLFCNGSKVPCWTNSLYRLCSAVLQWLECSSRMFHVERTAFTASVLLFCNGSNVHLECSMLNEQPISTSVLQWFVLYEIDVGSTTTELSL